MPDTETCFSAHRDLIFGIAYRMLGPRANADDVVQDAWLRWRQHADDDIDNPRAYLTRIATTLSIDALHRARRLRGDYPGPWLPEPVILDEASVTDGAEALVLAETLSIALLAMLESLSANERATFVLRTAFQMSYEQIAFCLEARPATCRQWFRRARTQLQGIAWDERHTQAERGLLERFVAAIGGGDIDALLALLNDDVVLVSDGGGQVAAATRPLHGRRAVTRFLSGINARLAGPVQAELAPLNGGWGVLLYLEGELDTVLTVTERAATITTLSLVRNPLKLAAIKATVAQRAALERGAASRLSRVSRCSRRPRSRPRIVRATRARGVPSSSGC